MQVDDKKPKPRFGGGSDHGSRGESDYASPEDIDEDDGAFGKPAEKDEEARRDTGSGWTRCSASEETSTISIRSGNRMLKYLLPQKIKKKKKTKIIFFSHTENKFYSPNLVNFTISFLISWYDTKPYGETPDPKKHEKSFQSKKSSFL